MRLLAACLCYLALLGGALFWTHSTSGWLVLGLAPALWLDRHGFRLLPWPGERRLLAALLVRVGLGSVVAGAFWQLGQGLFRPREVLFVGLAISLALFLLEVAFDLSLRLTERLGQREPKPRGLRLSSLAVMVLLLLPLAFLAPLTAFHPIHLVPMRTPADEGLAYEDVRVPTADGLELAGWFVPCEQTRGTVLFCHGHGGNRQQAIPYLGRFHMLGLNVLVCDFRGHGDSPGHTVTFGLREVRDVQAAEAYALRRAPGQPLALFGISYGGAVALQALPHLKNVRAAWIESTFSSMRDLADARLADYGYGPALRGSVVQVYSSLLWLDTGRWLLDANPIDHVSQLDIPIMFCHGRMDGMIPFVQGEALYAACGSPSKRCYWLDEGIHGAVPPAEVDEYFRQLDSFFGQDLHRAGQTARSVQ